MDPLNDELETWLHFVPEIFHRTKLSPTTSKDQQDNLEEFELKARHDYPLVDQIKPPILMNFFEIRF